MKNKILLLTISLYAFATKAQTLNLEQCLKMADTANIVLRNAKIDVAITEKQVDAYRSALLPKLYFAADYKYNGIIPGQLLPAVITNPKAPEGTFIVAQFGVPITLSNTLQLNQTIYNPQLRSALNSLNINQEVSEIQAKLTEQNIKYQLIQTFYNLQAVNKQLAFVTENLKNMDKMVSNLQAMVNQKMVVSTELDKLNITRLSLKNQEQTLVATKEKTENYLKLIIGRKVSDKVEFQQDDIVQQSILVDSKNIHPAEIQLLEAQERLNIQEKKGIRMAYLPVLSAYGTYMYSYNMRPESDFGKGINGAFIGLKLDWTLFDGLEKMHKAKGNRLNNEKIKGQLEYAKQQLEINIQNAKKQIEIQLQSLAIAQEQLTLAEKVRTQAKFSFEQGVINSNDLLKSETDLYQAQTNVVVGFVQLRQAELELLKVTGNIK